MQTRLIAIILLVVGIGLGYWGYTESQSISSQVSEVFEGAPSDPVMIKYIAGAALALAGVFLLVRSR